MKRNVIVTQELLFERLEPEVRYSVHQIATLVNGGVPAVQKLVVECVARGTLERAATAANGKRHVYWRPAAGQTRVERNEKLAQPAALLTGYDTQWRRFRDMCLAARRPGLPGLNVRYGVTGD